MFSVLAAQTSDVPLPPTPTQPMFSVSLGRGVAGPAQDAAGHDHQAGRGAGRGAQK